MRIKIFRIFLISVLLFSFQSFVSPNPKNQTEENAIACLNQSRLIMSKLLEANFSVVRINDTIKEAEEIFEVQQTLKEKGKKTDYSKIILICEEVEKLEEIAFRLKDEITVLEDYYKENSKGINTTEIDLLLEEIQKEMKNERYELIPDLIDKTYSEIALAQSRATMLKVFYESTTKGIKTFFKERYKELLILFLVVVVLFFSLKKPLEKAILNKKLNSLRIRRESIKNLIKKNQDIYFNKGRISQEEFTIKSKKLAEMIRDLDREISLVREQIYPLEKKRF